MKTCDQCSAPLEGRQTRFCSAECARAWRYRNNPTFRDHQLRYSRQRWDRINAELSPEVRRAHRSYFESRVLASAIQEGAARYEPVFLTYVDAAGSQKRYKPDAVTRNGIAVEVKIEFRERDRVKMLAVKRDNPDVEFRFVLGMPEGRVGRGAAITQAQWCEAHGFRWAHNAIPESWWNEPPNVKSVTALARANQIRRTPARALLRRMHVHGRSFTEAASVGRWARSPRSMCSRRRHASSGRKRG